jgi:hypothetical protein
MDKEWSSQLLLKLKFSKGKKSISKEYEVPNTRPRYRTNAK